MAALRPVAVIGDPVIDLYLRTTDVHDLSDKVLAREVGRFGGGTAANFAAGLSRLGHPAAMIGRVGDDRMGEDALADITRFGVDTQLVERQPGAMSSYCVVLLDERGDRFIIVVPAHEARPPAMTPAMQGAIQNAGALYVSWQYPGLAREAIAVAKQSSVPVLMDIERVVLESQSPDVVASADLIFFNQEGLHRFAAGLEPEQGLQRALTMGPRIAVVTQGRDGCYVASQEGVIHQKGFSVSVTDSTGAGDSFQAAFLYGYLRGWPLAATTGFAAAAGAISVTRMGPRHGAPTFAEIVAFLGLHDPDWTVPRT